MAFGGFLSAIGKAFGGYGEDVQTNLNRERQRLLDTQNTQRLGMDQQLHGAQMANLQSESAARDIQGQQRQQAMQSNERSYGTLKRIAPTHPLAQGEFDPMMDYTGELKSQLEAWRTSQKPPADSYTPFQGTDATGKPVVRPFNSRTGQFGPVADVAPKAEPEKDHFTFQNAGVDANGNPIMLRGNTTTGALEPTDVAGRQAAGVGGSVSAQSQQARLMAAVSEARLADERMRTYEADLLSGKKSINPLMQTGGTLTTNLAGSHSVTGAGTQALSEYLLNKSDPDYAQYLRDASTIGRAEQMMSPRGGNETMVRANALLSRAGTAAMKNTIDASQMARQALFGQSGGIEQVLTPTQSGKLRQGVERIKAGEHGNTPTTPDAQGTKPDLATRVQQLKAQGMTKDAALQQLRTEGYTIP